MQLAQPMLFVTLYNYLFVLIWTPTNFDLYKILRTLVQKVPYTTRLFTRALRPKVYSHYLCMCVCIFSLMTTHLHATAHTCTRRTFCHARTQPIVTHAHNLLSRTNTTYRHPRTQPIVTHAHNLLSPTHTTYARTQPTVITHTTHCHYAYNLLSPTHTTYRHARAQPIVALHTNTTYCDV